MHYETPAWYLTTYVFISSFHGFEGKINKVYPEKEILRLSAE